MYEHSGCSSNPMDGTYHAETSSRISEAPPIGPALQIPPQRPLSTETPMLLAAHLPAAVPVRITVRTWLSNI